ncbi:uncharacterized protein LOC131427883 [Malaya genurostris]|uniref:uncharacterized protein LOC131427883 n=1 Tax=Malaya genurostris TaxID=325434 RepID=UPI0026F3CCE1|nr:uncharacterized protein LOC131427883 [Malaya genurostris]
MTGPGDPDPGGGSTQTKENGRQWQTYEYESIDKGPYRLIVQLTERTENVVINKLTVGKILSQNNEYKENILNLKSMGRNKVLVIVKNAYTANHMQANQEIWKQKYKAYIPKHFLTVSGVITSVPVEMSSEEIMDNITCTVPILSVTRLHKFENEQKIPTTRIGVTFRSNQLPTEVRMFCCTNKVKPFVSKVIFCQKCLRYNHRTNNCRSQQRCDTCGNKHDEEGYKQCNRPEWCVHCRNEGHKSGVIECPERTRQNNLKIILSKSNLTSLEAQEQYPIYTQNSFNLLGNIEDYPTLMSSYAKTSENMIPTNRHKPREQTKQNPKRSSEETSNTININHTELRSDKKRKTGSGQVTNGRALFNPYKTNDAEKLQWKLGQMSRVKPRNNPDVPDSKIWNMDCTSDEEDNSTFSLTGYKEAELSQANQSAKSDGMQRFNYSKTNEKNVM